MPMNTKQITCLGGSSMKKWILFGKQVHDDLHDEIYVQFVANVFSAIVTAAMIGAYHLIFHA